MYKTRERGWRSGDHARLPPMWSGFDFRTRCHKWGEFVVGFRPCSQGFSPGSPVFLPPQKSTFQFQFDREFEGHGFVSRLTVMCNPRKTKLIIIIIFFFTEM